MELEQDTQLYTGEDYGVDGTMLCEADHAQECFVMENDDQSMDSDTSGDDAIVEENGHDEVLFV